MRVSRLFYILVVKIKINLNCKGDYVEMETSEFFIKNLLQRLAATLNYKRKV